MNSRGSMRRLSGLGEALRCHVDLMNMSGLVVVALALYLWRLGKSALPDWDEAIYAEVSKEMLHGHHWLTPYWNHQPFFDKPPLFYWAQMVDFRLFGVNEFAARLPSALAGVAIVLLVYVMTRRMAGPLAGLLAGLVLLTTHQFDRMMRFGLMDALLALLIYLMVYGYLRLRESPGDGKWFYLMCCVLGLGILDKGPAMLVAPAAIGVDWFLRERKHRLIVRRQWWLGALVLAAVVLPWHLWMIATFGWQFVDAFWRYSIFERAARTLNGAYGGPLFYVRSVGIGAFPWSVLGIWAAVRWVRRREGRHSLLWLLMGVTFVLYTLVATKYQHYVLPLYPALAIVVGCLLADWSRRRRMILYGALLVIAIGLGAAFWKVATWQGNSFANMERPLALAAKGTGDAGPLFVLGKPGPSDLDIRTVLFYSSRDVVWQQLPDQVKNLDAALNKYPAVDVVMEKQAAAILARQMAVRPVAVAGETELARVSWKQSWCK